MYWWETGETIEESKEVNKPMDDKGDGKYVASLDT